MLPEIQIWNRKPEPAPCAKSRGPVCLYKKFFAGACFWQADVSPHSCRRCVAGCAFVRLRPSGQRASPWGSARTRHGYKHLPFLALAADETSFCPASFFKRAKKGGSQKRGRPPAVCPYWGGCPAYSSAYSRSVSFASSTAFCSGMVGSVLSEISTRYR